MPDRHPHRYLIALGSNVPHPRFGRPEGVLAAAFAALDEDGLALVQASPVIRSAPLGPSRRRYANAAALVDCAAEPEELLHHLKAIERRFGRTRGAQRWASRVLDLDIVLWDGGAWASPGLTVPHIAFRTRGFVLTPAAAIAPRWRDPLTGLMVQHLLRRLTSPRRAPR